MLFILIFKKLIGCLMTCSFILIYSNLLQRFPNKNFKTKILTAKINFNMKFERSKNTRP